MDGWIGCHKTILSTQIHVIVNLPVHFSDSSCWVEQSLQSVKKDSPWTQSHSQPLNSFHHSIDHVRRNLKDVREEIVQQMHESILASHVGHPQTQVLNCRSGCLSMDQVSVNQCIFQQRCHRIDVIFAHLPNVLKHE